MESTSQKKEASLPFVQGHGHAKGEGGTNKYLTQECYLAPHDKESRAKISIQI